MATLRTNQFSSYSMSEDEYHSGRILNDIQKMVIQNRLSEAAFEKTQLTYDLTNPTACLQREAELQGRMLCLQQILDESDSSEIEMAEQATQSR
jgi:hypothetical protein